LPPPTEGAWLVAAAAAFSTTLAVVLRALVG
jgi:hypothetical protein